MDAEIVLDQNDGLGVRGLDVGQFFQDASVIHGGMAICDLDVAPAFERSKHHEEIGGAIDRAASGTCRGPIFAVAAAAMLSAGISLRRSISPSVRIACPRPFIHVQQRRIREEDANETSPPTFFASGADDICRHAADLAAFAPDVILVGTGTTTVAPLLEATRTVREMAGAAQADRAEGQTSGRPLGSQP
jgi:hypothetical protein